jgi:3-oxoacyl-[acyl-carrier protein] reductase
MLKKKSGTIINISSIAGKNGVPTASIYSATKHAVMGLSRSLMAEVREDNIRVYHCMSGFSRYEFFLIIQAPGLSANRETILSPDDVAESCYLAATLPERALINELENKTTESYKVTFFIRYG